MLNLWQNLLSVLLLLYAVPKGNGMWFVMDVLSFLEMVNI